MLGSVAALGFMHSLVRKIYEATDYEITALQVSVWRFTLSALMLWLFTMLAYRDSHPFSGESRRLALRATAVGIFYCFASIAMFNSTRYIPVPVFIVLFYTYPMIVSLLSRLLGERLPRVFWLFLLLTLGGVILTVASKIVNIGEMGSEAPLGILSALAAASLIASYIVCNQRILRGKPGDDLRTVAVGISWIISSGALTLIVVALVSGQGLGLEVARDVWGLLLLLGLVVSFAIFAMNVGIQRLGGPRAALIANAELIFTMIFAWIWLGEWLERLELLGGALILINMVVFARWQMRPTKPEESNPNP